MFFITGFTKMDENYGVEERRCFGYKETYEIADYSVRNNVCDINETIYDYAVIEKIEPGIHAICHERWFYKFNKTNEKYEPISEPWQLKHFTNFALG